MFDEKKFEMLSEHLKDDLLTANVDYNEDLLFDVKNNDLLYDLFDEIINNIFYEKYGSVESYLNGFRILDMDINYLTVSLNKGYVYYINPFDFKKAITDIDINAAKIHGAITINYDFSNDEFNYYPNEDDFYDMLNNKHLHNALDAAAVYLSTIVNDVLTSQIDNYYDVDSLNDTINNDSNFISEYLRDNNELSEQDKNELREAGLI